MKDFSYLLNRSAEEIGDIEEVRKRLCEMSFRKKYICEKKWRKKCIVDANMILDTISTYFVENNGYMKLCRMVFEKGTMRIYGFILVGENSILDKHEVQSDFEPNFTNLTGLSIIGYGIDDRVIDNFWIEEMIRLLWFLLEHQYEEYFNYVWFDCPTDKIDFYKNKYEMLSLKNNPNLLYKFIEMKM